MMLIEVFSLTNDGPCCAALRVFDSDLATRSDTNINAVVQAMFEDAGRLRATYPFEYRSAKYAQDPLSGKWTRTLKRELEVLTQVFE